MFVCIFNLWVSLWFLFFKQKTAYDLLISDWSSDVCSSDLSAWLGFGYTALIGVPVVVVIGAPVYFILLQRGLARWPYILLAGAAPGLIALVASVSLGFWAIICGIAVASLTHAIYRWVGPNNSFKPNLLRYTKAMAIKLAMALAPLRKSA